MNQRLLILIEAMHSESPHECMQESLNKFTGVITSIVEKAEREFYAEICDVDFTLDDPESYEIYKDFCARVIDITHKFKNRH
jgi:hypothetical protein